MVRKGSPVRVRQRALMKVLETGPFSLLRFLGAGALPLSGPLLGRIRIVSAGGPRLEPGAPLAASGLTRGPAAPARDRPGRDGAAACRRCSFQGAEAVRFTLPKAPDSACRFGTLSATCRS